MIIPYVSAQRSASGAHASAAHTVATAHTAPHSAMPAGHFSRARNGYPFASRRTSPLASPLTSLPFPFLTDSFNPDDIYSSGYPVASDLPPFLMQALQQFAGPGLASMGQGSLGQTLSAPGNHQPSSSDPLMIELQNGQYVRVNNTAIDGEALPLKLAPDHSQTNSARPPMITAPPSQPLPPAVLVFRDGHTEEVRDYTIADGTLYARGDYYTDGYWNKKINLATLNVPETLQANSTRNVNFVLPSSSNEVITRP
ncbi:MAG: hypothetical protein WAL56_01220 [Candidatus Sulfotelmatobacter sp.]